MPRTRSDRPQIRVDPAEKHLLERTVVHADRPLIEVGPEAAAAF